MTNGRLVFLLAGQSNMAGRGHLSNLPGVNDGAADDVLCFHQALDAYVPARHPLHADKPDKAGVGPALSFAEELVRSHPPAGAGGIALVPCAWGGSPLERWEEGGDLADEAVRRTKAALESLQSWGGRSDGGGGGTLAGILWHQGESDCGESVGSSSYGRRLAGALTSLRDALGDPTLPIVTGELGYFLNRGDERFRFCGEVNESIRRTCAEDLPSCACVSANGLNHRGDRLHFDGASQVEFGRRLARAWLSLQTGEEQRCRGGGAMADQLSYCFPTGGSSIGPGIVDANAESTNAHQPAVMD